MRTKKKKKWFSSIHDSRLTRIFPINNNEVVFISFSGAGLHSHRPGCISHSVSLEKKMLLMGSKLVHPSSPICNQVKLLSEETVMQGTEFSHSHPGQQWYLSRAWIGWGREGSVPFFFFFPLFVYSFSQEKYCIHILFALPAPKAHVGKGVLFVLYLQL